MDREELLEKLKIDVRSLLTSVKFGLDPDELSQDYCSMLGYPMPLNQLGFHHVLDMVKEMPDVVSVNIRADGTTILKAVGTESSRNVEELIANQRPPKANGRRSGFKADSASDPSTPGAPPRGGRAPAAAPARLKAQRHTRPSKIELEGAGCFSVPPEQEERPPLENIEDDEGESDDRTAGLTDFFGLVFNDSPPTDPPVQPGPLSALPTWLRSALPTWSLAAVPICLLAAVPIWLLVRSRR
ncbi:tudor domain-containing protein 5-like [Brachionichthys hirsutus]|uniref:tudor domain-containing protein 5-like n=1 Tax=Brachionichthys hirsutus TaxID=412623 RepID=UPI003604B195